jgi:chromosome partitioning protein
MQLIAAGVSLVVLIGGGIWWCVRRHINHLWRKIHGLEHKVRIGERKLDRTQESLDQAHSRLRQRKTRVTIQRERIDKLEKQFEESLSQREKLRNRAFQLDTQLRKENGVASKLTAEKLAFERQIKNLQVEIQTHVRSREEKDGEIDSLKQRVAELQEEGGIGDDVAEEIRRKEEELAHLRQENRGLEELINKNQTSLGTLEQASKEQDTKIESLNDQLDDLSHQNQEQGIQLDQKEKALDEVNQKAAKLQEQLEYFKEEYEKLSKTTVEEPGRIWERSVGSGCPFVPLGKRRTRIISLINLKGGVGKTTLAANLGAILGYHEKRVLLIDLDYQRSLSKLCIPDPTIRKLHEEKRTLQHFLLQPKPDAVHLLNCTFPIKKVDGCDIIINSEALEVRQVSDSLEDAEMQLQAEWLMNPKREDVRFLLRRALHDSAVWDRYDYVFLDCPPRLSTACINAIAASDFALIPVMLDPLSSVSAPNLLRKLNQLRSKNVLSDLKILGVVANRVKILNAQPIKSQADEWSNLGDFCKKAWGQAVHLFNSMIRQSANFEQAARRQNFAAFSDDLKPLFTDLMTEMEARIRNESGRLATVSS